MNLLVPHDGSEQAAKALDQAVEMATKAATAKITVIIVVPDLCLLAVGADECNTITGSLRKEAEGVKMKIAEKLALLNIQADIRIEDGAESDVILAIADEIKADLILIGAAGKHGGGKGVLGSVAGKVVNRSSHNVMVIR